MEGIQVMFRQNEELENTFLVPLKCIEQADTEVKRDKFSVLFVF
jgi:hypothetical protein